MNKRIKNKKIKQRLNTPTEFLYTGGFLTPYACPNCKMLYRELQAYNVKVCECGQHFLFKSVFK